MAPRSEEHTSELQSLRHLVCRLLLEKKNDHDVSILITIGDVAGGGRGAQRRWNLSRMTRRPPQHLFFFNDTATTEIYTLSLHDALPISLDTFYCLGFADGAQPFFAKYRSEEHTSELQSLRHLVCRLLLEKKIDNMVYTSTFDAVGVNDHVDTLSLEK